MDDLSVNLKKCPTGCIAGGTIVNHLMYVDDIVLLSPSATGLSMLLHVCGKYGLEHDIRFNSKKSAVLIFRNSFVKAFSYPSFVMNGESTSQLWWKYKVNSIRKLYVAYNNAFRMLFMLPRDCSASGMFAVHNVMSCPALVRKLVFGFYKRVKASPNSIVQAICASDIWWTSSIRANWNKLLYVHNAGQGIG